MEVTLPEKNPALIDPAVEHEAAYHTFIHHFWRAGEAKNAPALPRGDFAALIEKLRAEARGEQIASGWVPQHTYWLILQGEIVGESHLRHHLSPMLDILGGHIGYRIAPYARRKGYGTQILGLTMQKARSFGLPRLLLTCDTENIGSARIIEKNGGVLRDQFYYQPRRVEVSRYWIDLTVPSVSLSIPAPNAVVVTSCSASYPSDLVLQAGEAVEPGRREEASQGWVWCTYQQGQAGWVPESWLEAAEKGMAALRDYSSHELNLQAGEAVTLHFEESGWYWATNRFGESGWTPAQAVKPFF